MGIRTVTIALSFSGILVALTVTSQSSAEICHDSLRKIVEDTRTTRLQHVRKFVDDSILKLAGQGFKSLVFSRYPLDIGVDPNYVSIYEPGLDQHTVYLNEILEYLKQTNYNYSPEWTEGGRSSVHTEHLEYITVHW